MKRSVLIVALLSTACAVAPALKPSGAPSPSLDRTAEFAETCTVIWREELGRLIEPPALIECVRRATAGETGEQIRASVHNEAEAIAHREALAHPPIALLPNAGEAGYLHRDGILLRRADGSVYQWRSATSFLLWPRFLAGEDIQPTLTNYICSGTPPGEPCDPGRHPGANMVRVFGMLGGFGGSSPRADLPQSYLIPNEQPEYWQRADAFLTLLESRGLRVEFTLFADAQIVMPSSAEQLAFYHRARDELGRHWSVVGELVNEFEKNGVDPSKFDRPQAGQTLWSAGSGLGDGAPFYPPWDLTMHHGRRNAEWPRDAKGSGDLCCLGWSDTLPPLKVPVVQDEPMGASGNLDKVRGGSRSNVPRDFGDFGALAAMWGGATLHTDSGVLGLPFNDIERACAYEFYRAMAFVPAEAPTWAYQRGDQASDAGVGNMPMLHNDATSLRTFCKGNGAAEWCVAIRPTADWKAVARDGWQILDEPRRGLVHLVRQ